MDEPSDAVHPIDPVDEEAGVERRQRPRRLPLFAAGFAAVALFAVLMTLIRPADDPPPSPAPGTTATATEIPIAIPEATEPRPASPGLASSPDWVAVGTGRFQPGVTPWVPVWTGAEIVLQRTSRELVAFDPATEAWRELTPAPIPIGADSTAVWADDELVVWTDEGAAAWDPVTDDWRVLGRWLLEPSPSRRIVWTGAEVVDFDAAIAVDPIDGSSRPITSPPRSLGEREVIVWAGDRAVGVPGGAVYVPTTDTWADAPPSGLSPLAADAVWTGDHVFAADYLMQARGYDPLTDTWSSYPDVPLRFSECAPSTHMLRGGPLIDHCSGLALWDTAEGGWLPIALPGLLSGDAVVSTTDEVYAVTGYGLYRLATHVLESDPRRLAVGSSLLDVPDGWSVGDVDSAGTGSGPAAEHTVTVAVEGPVAEECLVRATSGDSATVIQRFLVPGHTVTRFELTVGGKPVDAVSVPAGAYDADHHLVWPTGSTDVVDVACTDSTATAEIARHVWSPWQDTG
jgi:hypothetical protein